MKFSRSFCIITFVLLVLTTSFFSYIYWDPTLGGRILRYFDLGIIFFVYHKKKEIVGTHFNKNIDWIFKLSFLSVIGNTLLYYESPVQNIISRCSHAFILYYFLLHYYRIKEITIIRILTILSLFILVIQCVQQYSYPIAFWGTQQSPNSNELIEIRNGLFRFRISSYFFAMLTAFFYWQDTLRKVRVSTAIMFALSLMSVYLFLTRQIIATTLVAIFVSIFLIKGNKLKLFTILLLIIFGFILYNYSELFFEEFINTSKNEANDDNIRVYSAVFFLQKIKANPISFAFGNGIPALCEKWGMNNGYWITDVGFIGECFIYGVFYIIVYFITLWKLYGYRKQIPLYIKMYIIATFLISFMIFPYRTRVEFMLWAMALYICDLHINKSNLRYQ